MGAYPDDVSKGEHQAFRVLQQNEICMAAGTFKSLNSKWKDGSSSETKYLLNETRKWQLKE